MSSPNRIETTRTERKAIANRLIKRLGSLYTEARHGRMLEAYLKNHIFTSSAGIDHQIDALPLDTAQDPDVLDDVATELVDAFFEQGKEQTLGWNVSEAKKRVAEQEEVFLSRLPPLRTEIRTKRISFCRTVMRMALTQKLTPISRVRA